MSVLIIAEAGVNHNGDLNHARQLIEAAAEAGADIVKFQTSRPEISITRSAPKADYQAKNTGNSETQLEMLKKLVLSEYAHKELLNYCHKRNIEFLSTPFYTEGVDFLVNQLKLRRLKIGSGEIVNAPLLLRAAQKKVPIILSTGMSTLKEVEAALGIFAFGYMNKNAPSRSRFREAFLSFEGKDLLYEKITLLHCTTEYPAPIEDANLCAIDTLAKTFNLPAGLSDHTLGIELPIAAVARGAMVIEKHLTLGRNLPGPDHKASLEPDEFRAMVSAIRNVEKALGNGDKVPAPSELNNRKTARKSLVAACSIRKGSTFTEKNIAIKRPGLGLSPMHYWDLIGQVAGRDYKIDECISI